jgi:hypothetical protein
VYVLVVVSPRRVALLSRVRGRRWHPVLTFRAMPAPEGTGGLLPTTDMLHTIGTSHARVNLGIRLLIIR